MQQENEPRPADYANMQGPLRVPRMISAARSRRRESLHIADTKFWPDPSEAAAKSQAKSQEKLVQKLAEKQAERAVKHACHDFEAAAEAERRAAEEAAAAKAAAVLEALETADMQRAREETDAAARLTAKKKAKLDAQATQLVDTFTLLGA